MTNVPSLGLSSHLRNEHLDWGPRALLAILGIHAH